MLCFASVWILIAGSAAVATSDIPPVFSQEFSLNYTVTNLQYGFKVLGRWTVDHARLRERTDSANMTLQPRIEIKDFAKGDDARFDDAQDVWVCGNASGTQTAWALPPNATLVGEGPTQQRWRVFHADIGVCVDFFVGYTSSGTGQIAQATLPSTLLYFVSAASAMTSPRARSHHAYTHFLLSSPPLPGQLQGGQHCRSGNRSAGSKQHVLQFCRGRPCRGGVRSAGSMRQTADFDGYERYAFAPHDDEPLRPHAVTKHWTDYRVRAHSARCARKNAARCIKFLQILTRVLVQLSVLLVQDSRFKPLLSTCWLNCWLGYAYMYLIT